MQTLDTEQAAKILKKSAQTMPLLKRLILMINRLDNRELLKKSC